MHDAAVIDRLRLVRAFGRELRDVVPGRKRPLAGAAHDHAAHAVVGRQRGDRFAQHPPHRLGERIELVGPVEDDRRDRSVPLERNEFVHPAPSFTDRSN
jgi:hypothetical protein